MISPIASAISSSGIPRCPGMPRCADRERSRPVTALCTCRACFTARAAARAARRALPAEGSA